MDRQESQQPIGATDAVGDETGAKVGLLDGSNTKSKSPRRAGRADEGDDELNYNLERL